MLFSLNSSTPTNAASTSCDTMSAMESSLRGLFRSRMATTELNTLISHAQNSSEPSRPAHRPDSLNSQPSAPSALLCCLSTYSME